MGSKPSVPEISDEEILNHSLTTTPDAKLPIIYSDVYNIGFWKLENLHPFDSKKYVKVYKRLLSDGLIETGDIYEPIEAPPSLLKWVHTDEYLESLKSSYKCATILEVPPVAILPNSIVHKKALKPMRFATTGSILGAKLAVESSRANAKQSEENKSIDNSDANTNEALSVGDTTSSSSSSSSASSSSSSSISPLSKPVRAGWSINLAGGYHHASGHRGGGFCAYADISLSLLYLMKKYPGDAQLHRFMIVDLDAHQGNGHEMDKKMGVFSKQKIPGKPDPSVFIFDMFNAEIYPGDLDASAAIDCSVPLYSGTQDEEYLTKLRTNLTNSFRDFQPQFVLYNAGTDCLRGDPLGNLDISPEGIIARDEFVFRCCMEAGVPILMVLSGGYQKSNAEVIARSISNLRETFHLWEPLEKHSSRKVSIKEKLGKQKKAVDSSS